MYYIDFRASKRAAFVVTTLDMAMQTHCAPSVSRNGKARDSMASIGSDGGRPFRIHRPECEPAPCLKKVREAQR